MKCRIDQGLSPFRTRLNWRRRLYPLLLHENLGESSRTGSQGRRLSSLTGFMPELCTMSVRKILALLTGQELNLQSLTSKTLILMGQ